MAIILIITQINDLTLIVAASFTTQNNCVPCHNAKVQGVEKMLEFIKGYLTQHELRTQNQSMQKHEMKYG